MFDYQLKRSKRRKTVAIKVHRQLVTVYAPFYVSKEQINIWLQDKKNWVETQLQKQVNLLDTKQYPLNEKTIKIFSDTFQLQFEEGVHSTIKQECNTLKIINSTRVTNKTLKYKTLLEEFLTDKLTAYIEMRIAYYCELMTEALPENLRIRTYKRKWGSCNSKRELTFNLLLIGAPHTIIDYVIVHELAHLRYLNHSDIFWQRVAQFYPEYKVASNWLSKNGESLQWVF